MHSGALLLVQPDMLHDAYEPSSDHKSLHVSWNDFCKTTAQIALTLHRHAVWVHISMYLPPMRHFKYVVQSAPNRNAGGCQLGLFRVLYQVRISFCPSMETRKPATTGTAMEIACRKSRPQYTTYRKKGHVTHSTCTMAGISEIAVMLLQTARKRMLHERPSCWGFTHQGLEGAHMGGLPIGHPWMHS